MTKTKYAVDAATRRIRFKRKLKKIKVKSMVLDVYVAGSWILYLIPRVSDYMQYSVFAVGLVGNDI